jgi:hypothetical protein
MVNQMLRQGCPGILNSVLEGFLGVRKGTSADHCSTASKLSEARDSGAVVSCRRSALLGEAPTVTYSVGSYPFSCLDGMMSELF